MAIEFPAAFAELFQPARYKAFHGGRGSGKSHSMAGALVVRARQQRTCIVCCREIQKSIADSVHALIVAKIEQFGWRDEFVIHDTEILHANGSRFFFRGLFRNVESGIKSIEGLDIAWVEEAQTVSADSLEQLIPTVRRPNSEIWFSWNPRFEEDAVDRKFRGPDGPPPRSIVRQVNWDANPWFPDVLRDEMTEDYRRDPIRASHVWGGDYKRASEGALWSREVIERQKRLAAPELKRIVVAVDPAITAEEGSNETGIVVVGEGRDGMAYVLADKSGRYHPKEWAQKAIAAFDQFGADRIVAEGNQGGAMVEHTLKSEREHVPVTIVHASRGKVARAEPVAALYEDGKVWHVGTHAALEKQLQTWVQGEESPDRLDALVWGVSFLMFGQTELQPRMRAL